MAGPADSDNTASPKPTAEDQPNGVQSDKVAQTASKPPHAPPAAAEPVELDDFGLPIRKWVPPPELPEEKIDDATPTKPQESATLPNGEDEPKISPTKTDTAAKPNADVSDDDDDFKDATSRAATPPPQVAVKEVGPETQDATLAPPSDDNPVAGGGITKAESSAGSDGRPPSSPAREDENTKEAEAVPVAQDAKTSTTEAAGAKATPAARDAAAPATETTESKAVPEAQGTASAAPDAAPSAPTSAQHARNVSTSGAGKEHTRNISAAGADIGEFSHHQATTKEDEKKDDDDGDWQEMPAYAPYDIYDEDNKLVAKEHTEEEEANEAYGYGGLGGAGKGYTRVIMDDDAESATSMDDNTKYLFKDVHGTSLAEDQEEQRDAVSQMEATKDLLTEGQRVAYVGLIRIEIFQLVKAAESIEKTRSSKKWVTTGAEATKMWGQKMMIRLYAHMDISAAEQVMVEQLADHGVIPSDLTPILMTNARVKNPMAEEKGSTASTPADPNRSSMSLSTPKDNNRDSTSPTSPRSPAPPASPVPPEEELAAEPPPPYEAHPEGEMPDVKMPSQLPSSQNLEIDLRWTVLCDLFLILIADSTYDARSRVLLERVGKSLEIDWLDIRKFEKRVTDALEMQQQAEKENWNEGEHMETRRKNALKRRYAMMGLATVGGGLVIGLSAGLLAPLIGAGLAAGFTTIGISGTTAFLGGAGGAAIITTAAASSGSVVGVRAANRRTGAVKTFEYRPLHNNKRVNLIVTISGWMTGKVDDVRLPFSTVDPIMGDLYSVLWEPEMLRSTGDTINILATEALTQGVQQVLASTLLMGLMSALQLPVILTKLAYLIDNPWAVSLDRATAAGLILADSLIDRNLGTRPVTLVGYSIGARVIFSCLQELARRGAYGLVQNVYMFGSPVIVKKDEFLRARTVVPGRFVNGYNRNDWILGYLFRLTNGGIRRVAGLAPVDDCPWCENVDVTDLVKGHMDYRKMMPRLLRECGWLVESDEFTEIEDPDPENHEKRQRELINEIEEARRELEKEGQQAKKSRFSIFGRKKKMEKANWEIYEDSAKAGSASKTEDENKDGLEGNNHGVLFDVDAIRAELARDEMQVTELKSTLPPMKLDLNAMPNPRDSFRGTKSADASTLSLRPSHDTRRISEEPSPIGSSRGRIASPYYTEPDPYREDEVSMTFDTSFDDPPPRPAPPPKDDPAPARPEMKSAQTVPNMTLRDPWGDPDDDDFGKEKEMTMTFA